MPFKKILLSIFYKIPFKNHNYSKFKFKWYLRILIMKFLAFFRIYNLNLFLKISGSDKYENYFEIYKILENLTVRKNTKKILEIGIGGHNQSYSGGSSLLALLMYFDKSLVYGLDIVEKKFLDSKRLSTIQCSQDDAEKLNRIGNEIGKFDLIIDDGSHFGNHQVITFTSLFEYLNDGGIYIIEDLGGSYTKAFDGDPNFDKKKNIVGLLQSKIHAVNSMWLNKKNFTSLENYIDIDKIFFVQDCIVLKKKIKDRNNYLSDHKSERSLDELKIEENYNKDSSGVINIHEKK